jgi:two-component system nitrogen regulation response regulator NtrX
MPETVLIVDDEEPVRRTFADWLAGSGLDVRVVAVADAESALLAANETPVDLAVLDWNLGAGNDGLRLLEDLAEFNPDIVAILITGYADRATPLDALRKGVRDYLDKNQDLTRTAFLAAVTRQLDRIVPAKRQRHLTQGLAAFRAAVEKALPLVQAASALTDPVPLPRAAASLIDFAARGTGAADGVLLVRRADDSGGEVYRAYGRDGRPLDVPLVPFARSLAATVLSMQEPVSLAGADASAGEVEWQPFERGRSSLLAAPLPVATGVHAVLELFDKSPAGTPFADADRRLAAAAADLGADLLRQALAEHQSRQLLVDALSAALSAGESVERTLTGGIPTGSDGPPPDRVLAELTRGLDEAAGGFVAGADAVRLAEAVRELAVRHGPGAVRHCTRLVESAKAMLDDALGAAD